MHTLSLEELGQIAVQFHTEVLVYPTPKTCAWQESRLYLHPDQAQALLALLKARGLPFAPIDRFGAALAEKTAEGEPLPWSLMGHIPTDQGLVRLYTVKLPVAAALGEVLSAAASPGPEGLLFRLRALLARVPRAAPAPRVPPPDADL